MIALAGCVAQAEGAEIMRRAPMIDLVVGPQAYHRLPEMVPQAAARRAAGRPDLPAIQVRRPARSASAQAPTAFLTVQEGCDKFCTFCVVPYTRGAESRGRRDIEAEARSWSKPACARSRCWARTSTPGADGGAGLAGLVRGWRRSRALTVSATPPAIRPTWTTR